MSENKCLEAFLQFIQFIENKLESGLLEIVTEAEELGCEIIINGDTPEECHCW